MEDQQRTSRRFRPSEPSFAAVEQMNSVWGVHSTGAAPLLLGNAASTYRAMPLGAIKPMICKQLR